MHGLEKLGNRIPKFWSFCACRPLPAKTSDFYDFEKWSTVRKSKLAPCYAITDDACDCHGGLTVTAVQVYCAELSVIYFVIRVTLNVIDTGTIPIYV